MPTKENDVIESEKIVYILSMCHNGEILQPARFHCPQPRASFIPQIFVFSMFFPQYQTKTFHHLSVRNKQSD